MIDLLGRLRIYHPKIAPVITIIKGRSFINNGINVIEWEIGLIHVKAAPLMIAKEERLIIGLIIRVSSFSEINGAELEEDHSVTIEKRIE